MSNHEIRWILLFVSLMFVADAYVPVEPLAETEWYGWMGFLGMGVASYVLTWRPKEKK